MADDLNDNAAKKARFILAFFVLSESINLRYILSKHKCN